MEFYDNVCKGHEKYIDKRSPYDSSDLDIIMQMP